MVAVGLADVHRPTVRRPGVQRGQHGGGDVVDVRPAPERPTGSDRHPVPTGLHPPQHDVLAGLPVVRPVDHRQPQHHRTAGQPARLDVELVVVVGHLGQAGPAVGVAVAAQLRVLGQRYRGDRAPGAQPIERLVHVLAGQHHGGHVGQHR
jgi:hypothetical protein